MFENIEKVLTIMLLAIGVKEQTKTQFFLTVTFQRFSKKVSVNVQCLSEIERTPT